MHTLQPKTFTFLYSLLLDGNPQQAANPSATVIVNVTDLNDEPPVMSEGSYQFTVFENATLGSFVGPGVWRDIVTVMYTFLCPRILKTWLLTLWRLDVFFIFYFDDLCCIMVLMDQ